MHTFVICAYKESLYLEECIRSLINQNVKSTIKMVTSTPNSYIQSLAVKYDIPLVVNQGEAGIVQDWNFGLEQCTTPYVTIAHQDDLYYESYAKVAIQELNKRKTPLIFFANYNELWGEEPKKSSVLLEFKRMMLFVLRFKKLQKCIFLRRRILSFGNAICCPSVTYAMKNLPHPIFTIGFRSNQDWETWERLSALPGDFIYYPKRLMSHRIHKESETSKMISEQLRIKEDYKMFCKFWHPRVAKILAKGYSTSERFNQRD